LASFEWNLTMRNATGLRVPCKFLMAYYLLHVAAGVW